MAVELGKVWGEISDLVKDGISLIPVREEGDNTRPAKTPYGSWTEYQQRIADEGELWAIMEAKNTTAIAAVCGSVSGNLECIDIDSKYNPGIDATLLSDINKFYPQLSVRLRIHCTPSGGYHIIYRIKDHNTEGNLKLAGRMKTEEELHTDYCSGKRKPTKSVNFLETRGEGGYFLFPPSLGYTIHQANPIPLIMWEERCSLINLCRSYCEVTKVAATPQPSKAQNDFYTTNPFEDFNYRCDPVQLMESQGWSFLRENTKFIWFTRPGKDQGVSASFNTEKRIFYIFTSSTDLESTRGYNPSTLYAEFTHSGDKKAAFRALVQDGFGKVKRSVEQSIVKKAVINGQAAVPPNFSDEAKQHFAQLQEQFTEQHPYGIFWEYDDKGKFKIGHEDFLQVAKSLGFRYHQNNAVQINHKFIEQVTLIEFFDSMKGYIQEEEAKDYTDICSAFEKFIQSSGKFIVENRLEKFDDTDCIQDSADTCYKFYDNVAIRITASSITKIDYNDIDGYIWADKMLGRDYIDDTITASPLYENYLKNATGTQDGKVKDNVRSIIGYLTHDFNSPVSLYIIVMTEMVNDVKKGGGSGKNIFINVLKKFVGVSTASGSMVKWDDKFYAVWNERSRIYFIPDIPKRVPWSMLKSAIEDPLVNKKYKSEFSVPIEQAPKLVFNTNFSYEDDDGGLRRRIRHVEFTDYYTIHGGVDVVHGKLFPDGFSKEDMKGFDDFILSSIQYHLKEGCKIQKEDLSQNGWDKKFMNQFGDKTLEFFLDNIHIWLKSDYVEVSNFQKAYDEYVATDLKEKYKLSQRTLNAALVEFCDRYSIKFQQSVVKRLAHQTRRVHIFDGTFEGEQFFEDEFPF